jgi:hypothetical protein
MEAFLSNKAVNQYERLNEPLLSFLVEPPYTVETDLTEEETAMIEEGVAEYRANPSSFTPWAKVRRG